MKPKTALLYFICPKKDTVAYVVGSNQSGTETVFCPYDHGAMQPISPPPFLRDV